MDTYRNRATVPSEILANKILANYFGGWSTLAKCQFKSESENWQIATLELLAKHKEIEAYKFFKENSGNQDCKNAVSPVFESGCQVPNDTTEIVL